MTTMTTDKITIERNGVTCSLYCGDCIHIAPTIGGIDNIVTDQPYGISYQHSGGGNGRHYRTNVNKIVGDDKPFDPSPWIGFKNVVLMGANHFSQRLPHGRWLVWDKLDGMEQFDSFSDVEFAWHNSRVGGDRVFRLMWKGICRAEQKSESKPHPSLKPTSLMEWLIKQARVPDGETIMDPYMGSGSTALACLRTGHNFVGIEKDESHFYSAVERIQREANQGVML